MTKIKLISFLIISKLNEKIMKTHLQGYLSVTTKIQGL